MKIHQKYITFTFILGIAVLLAFYFIPVFAVVLIIGLIYAIWIAYCLCEIFFGNQELLEKIILGLLIEIFIVIITGSTFFYLYKLNDLFFIAIILGFPVLIFFMQCKNETNTCNTPCKSNFSTENPIFTHCKQRVIIFWTLILVYLIATLTLFYILISHATSLPIKTTWEVMPKYFFVLFFVDTISLIAILLNKNRVKKNNYKLIFISIYLFLFFSVAYFIYKLGYGFDSFIHRATLNFILKTGTITPKPFYYIGEYSIIFYLSKLIGANVNILEKILVPFLTAIFLPATLNYYLNKKTNNSCRFNCLIILSLFLIPFNFLIFTTPQNLANLFLIILIIFALNYSPKEKKTAIFLILNALSIFCIHPISGIPAFLFLILFFLWGETTFNYETNTQKKTQNTIYIKLFFLIACFGLITFPVSWLINSAISPQTAITINPNILNNFVLYLQNLKLLSLHNTGQFKIILNIIYFFYFNLPIIFILIFIFSVKKICQEKKIKEYVPYLILFLILFFNYLFLKIIINFKFLINYEQNNYTNRVLGIAYLFLMPFLLNFINNFWQKIQLKKIKTQYFVIIALSICLCASLYLTYPRNDNFSASHGYNTSKYDIMAVNYIDKDSKEDFIVLSNQQVSAAALQEFGFKKYFNANNDQLFYYSIPTGGALYQYYLEMANKKPTKEIMKNAMKLVGVKESYFVINKYWWRSGQTIDLAKLVADEYAAIGNGDIYIFKFKM